MSGAALNEDGTMDNSPVGSVILQAEKELSGNHFRTH